MYKHTYAACQPINDKKILVNIQEKYALMCLPCLCKKDVFNNYMQKSFVSYFKALSFFCDYVVLKYPGVYLSIKNNHCWILDHAFYAVDCNQIKRKPSKQK